jgi:hypothetical protein
MHLQFLRVSRHRTSLFILFFIAKSEYNTLYLESYRTGDELWRYVQHRSALLTTQCPY